MNQLYCTKTLSTVITFQFIHLGILKKYNLNLNVFCIDSREFFLNIIKLCLDFDHKTH